MAALQTMQVMGDEVKHHTLGTHPDVPDPTIMSLESILDGDAGGLLEMLDDQGSTAIKEAEPPNSQITSMPRHLPIIRMSSNVL
jgi:hypothetical protein